MINSKLDQKFDLIFSTAIILVFILTLFSYTFQNSHQNAETIESTEFIKDKEWFNDPNFPKLLSEQSIFYHSEEYEDLILKLDKIRGVKEELHSLIRHSDGIVLDSIPKINFIRVAIPKKNLGEFSKSIDQFSFENNIHKKQYLLSNDPLYPIQWHLDKIKISGAWNNTLGDENVLVGIIDTGVDYLHPDLIANYDSRGYDWYRNDTDPMDELDHGTHVSGILSAEINNGIGGAGIGNIKFFMEKSFGDQAVTGDWYLAQGVVGAVDKGANITSSSWGGGYSLVVEDAFKYAVSKGVINIVSSGNSGTNDTKYPAALPETISVGATTIIDTKADISSWGNNLTLTAPGVNIHSTLPNNNYGLKSGTSMSAPIVSGVIALMFSFYGESIVNLNTLPVLFPYIVDDLGKTGYDNYFGYGRINATKALSISTQPISNFPEFVPIMRKSTFINFTSMDIFDRDLNISIDLFVNSSYVSNIASFINSNSYNYTFLFNSSDFSEGFNYSFRINSSNGIYSDIQFSNGFLIDNIALPITNVVLNAPTTDSINSAEIFADWEVFDLDGPIHSTEIFIVWDINNERYLGQTFGNSITLPIYNFSNRTDYKLRLEISDFIFNFTYLSGNFIIENPNYIPEIIFTNSQLIENQTLSGNISISWIQSDLNNNELISTLWIKNNNTNIRLPIGTNYLETINSIIWNSTEVPDNDNYYFIIELFDSFTYVYFFSPYFEIDNPHLPVVDLLSPNSDTVSRGKLNLTWSITDIDNDSISGLIEYRFHYDPFTWFHLLLINSSQTNSYIFDTGALNVENDTKLQLRFTITDNYFNATYSSNFIVLIKPISPKILTFFPNINNVSYTNISEIVPLTWQNEDLNNDLVRTSIWIFSFDEQKWIHIIETLKENYLLNTSEYSPGKYLLKIFSSDEYYNITSISGLIEIGATYPFDYTITFPQKNSRLINQIPIRYSVSDIDSHYLNLSLFFTYFNQNNWVFLDSYSIQSGDGIIYWNSTTLVGEIKIMIIITDNTFEKATISDEFILNFNSHPLIVDIVYPNIAYTQTSEITIITHDQDQDSLLLTIQTRELNIWIDYKEILITPNNYSNFKFAINWDSFSNGLIDVNFIVRDILHPDLDHLTGTTNQSIAIEIVFPRISFFSSQTIDLVLVKSKNTHFQFLIKDPKLIISTGSFLITDTQNTTQLSIKFSISDKIVSSKSDQHILTFDLDLQSQAEGKYFFYITLESDYGVYYFDQAFRLESSEKTINFISYFLAIISISIFLFSRKIIHGKY